MNVSATDIVNKMMEKDAFSQWLGIERISEKTGYCQLRMSVREEMLNGFGITHGGITFSLADSAFAFASNSQGRHAVSVHTSIKHLKPVMAGDILVATATENKVSKSFGYYQVTVKNQHDEQVALFEGMVYRKAMTWTEDMKVGNT